MATKKKLLEAAAGSAGGAALNVEDVFSTYLYTGNDTSQTITNGIDLSGEGGMTWLKTRNDTHSHYLFDTERGAGYYLNSDTTGAQAYHATAWVTAFNSDGFDIGYSVAINDDVNDHASWTFRKAPKFFDVVTYTGDGTNGRQIPHNLGSNIGMVICKGVDVVTTWAVKHKDRPTDEGQLNSTNAFAGYGNFPTSFAGFTDTYFTVDAGGSTNANGYNYVAYLFAHNDGDGDFGDGTQDIIKCGSYTGNGATLGPVVNLGWEPQWILVKSTSASNWVIVDNMRGLVSSGNDQWLKPNSTDAEVGIPTFDLLPNGFQSNGVSGPSGYNTSSQTYIYIAIRRGPMAVPESATDVFNPTFSYTEDTNVQAYLGSTADALLQGYRAGGISAFPTMRSRITGGNRLTTSSTAAEVADSTSFWDNMLGFDDSASPAGSPSTTVVQYLWKRAPNFFDVVAYTGNGTAGRTVSHNLGVAPEMMWVKCRSTTEEWAVYHTGSGAGVRLPLNQDWNPSSDTTIWNNTSPSVDNFTVGTSLASNGSGRTYIAYLFASLDGVSKVGSYTGTEQVQNIDCGFTSGARFVLIKKTNSTGNWAVFDTERGLVSGNDPKLNLDNTNAEVTSFDYIDPYSGGFALNTNSTMNGLGDTYIYYAVSA